MLYNSSEYLFERKEFFIKMDRLTPDKAREINSTMVTEDHLLLHAANVAAAMGAMAEHFGADKEHWEAVGFLHDYDYEKYPDEHLKHTEEPLRELGVPEEDIRAIKYAYRKLFLDKKSNMAINIQLLQDEGDEKFVQNPHVQRILEFVKASERGFMH
jgi:predicted hydrolase (HD superfamily)